MKRRYLWWGWSVIFAVLVALLVCPLRTTLIRLAIMGFGAAVWLGFLILTWRKVWLRFLIIILTLLFVSLPLLPSYSQFDSERLRRIYVDQLKTFDKTRYVYGGENCLGIDCSGLVRAAMFRALRIYGIEARDFRALRSSFHLWWSDSNAIDLGKGRTGDTVPVGDGEYSKLADHEAVLPGDLAVTESGSHVLAYLGNETWIEAEPSVGRTHIFDLSGEFANLAGERVRFVRWRWFQEKTKPLASPSS